MKGLVFISYGLGGAAIETWASGLRLFTQRCKALGLDTMRSPYQWSDVNEIVLEINRAPPNIPIGVVGASLGANETVDIASHTRRPIRYLGGFQSSTYGFKANITPHGLIGVPANVQFGDNIYNPSWFATFGLGYQRWENAVGNKFSVVRNIPIYASHPDDWGVAQDIIFSALHKHMVSSA